MCVKYKHANMYTYLYIMFLGKYQCYVNFTVYLKSENGDIKFLK